MERVMRNTSRRKAARSLALAAYSPETLMHLAYSVYVADDQKLSETVRRELSQANVEEFRKVFENPLLAGSEAAYALGVRAVVSSYVGAIWRLRLALDRAIDEAKHEQHDYLERSVPRKPLNPNTTD
ncbi:MAG: hypothetical protein KGI78_04160 [Patescibacteria group bacterium]|nr:hypothetical protein [Patescibacteria group bacterium]MDE1945527.1 hypothetical protein [Patescibacteria group bacterium]MDE2058009.1 hypothetical protein [Patescibacteria group bacterium]